MHQQAQKVVNNQLVESVQPIALEDIKPADRHNGYPLDVPRWVKRVLEAIPGLFTWSMILLPFIAAFAGFPEVVIVVISFLTVYWTFRGVRFLYGLYIGWKRMQRDLRTDFVSKLKKQGKPEMKYVFICPIVKEGMETLVPTIEAWANQDIGAEKISVVFALEESFKKISVPNCEELIRNYSDRFAEMIISIHPNNIEGEVVGVKGANINWATRRFVKLIEERGEKMEGYLLITCDCDLRPHSKYLSAITHKYHSVDKPKQKFFTSAVYRLNNNLWRVPIFVRIQSAFLTLVMLHLWIVEKRWRDSFSSYVVNLETVHFVGYWDPTVGIDDVTFYWNSKVRFDGDFYGEEVYVPVDNDAVENQTTVKTYKSLYKQQFRWGSGIVCFPLTMAALYKNSRISLIKKLDMFVELFNNQVSSLSVVYLLFVALPIIGWISEEYNYSVAAIALPRAVSYMFTALMLLNFPVLYIKRKILQPPKFGFWRNLLDYFETLLVTVNMLTFSFIPYVQAQSNMVIGKGFKKRYYATEKERMGG